jgi:glycolate oxidase subunit GlcD
MRRSMDTLIKAPQRRRHSALTPGLLDELRAIAGKENVLAEPEQAMAYECDGYAFHRHTPDAVLLVTTRAQIEQIVKLAVRHRIPFVCRGAGTGLSGGAVARFGGIVIELSRMKAIREIDYEGRYASTEPGLVNIDLSRATAGEGYYFAPDPSSQMVATLGGNLAENAGGPHCLKYGVTTNHVVNLEVVLPSGETCELGSRAADCPGYDLTGVFVGSEGTLGIATLAGLRLTRLPQAQKTMLAAFASMKDACDAVSGIIEAGIIPAALEMMDHRTIAAVEASVNRAGLPTGADAVLIIELDGLCASLEHHAERVLAMCREHNCTETRLAKDEAERAAIWKGRKQSFGTMGRLARDLYLMDSVVPRNKLSEVVVRLYELADRAGVRLASVFHAGDGNIHPVLLFDRNKPGEEGTVVALAKEMLRVCVDAGGTLSAEHGIGSEKNEYMGMVYNDDDLAAMTRLRAAFNPDELCNPGKLFPSRHCRFM